MSVTKTIAQGNRHGFLRIVAGCLVLVLALAACGTSSTPAGGSGPVTMGVLSCFTGTLASLGQAMLQGSQVAQKA
jgi:ABC-type branched-subunit amino acid transport system substrate-binding protein